MSRKYHLAIVGSGPSAIYLLKHLLEQSEFLNENIASISVYEKGNLMGMGMPYSPEMVDKANMANIPSEEMPPLLVSFADWLRSLDLATLEELEVVREEISEQKIYSRIALGKYLQAQYQALIEKLANEGVKIHEFPGCRVLDILCDKAGKAFLVTGNGRHSFDKVFIATGHHWPKDDRPDNGYYASPWPILKLLPKDGEYFNYPIGTLGASLSAFDVVASLAMRHGEFIASSSGLEYRPAPGTEDFKIIMHAGHGKLPHLRYGIEKLQRKIYQHVTREHLLSLVNVKGFLRIDFYFDVVCRPALRHAFMRDGLSEIAELLKDKNFTFAKFVGKMNEEHQYYDAFAGMRAEMVEARDSVLGNNPIHWKEVIDDLIYTLNFHAELMPAEDHIFLNSTVMPFLMNVIAALPLGSGDQLLALHEAGKLELIPGMARVRDEPTEKGLTTVRFQKGDGDEEMHYRMFVDCSGQKPVAIEHYPFASLVTTGVVRKAQAKFANERNVDSLPDKNAERVATKKGRKVYDTGGIDIDGTYRVIGTNGRVSSMIYDISFTHTTGVRPYSYGLQSCSDTGAIVAQSLKLAFEESLQSKISENEVTQIYEKV